MFLLFHGSDEFSAHEALAQVRMSLDFGLNEDRFSGADGDLASIRVACDTLPFLSENRLVIVEGLPKRRKGSKDGGESDTSDGVAEPDRNDDAGRDGQRAGKSRKVKSGGSSDARAFVTGLAEYVTHVPVTTVLVILAGEKLEDTHPLLKAARDSGEVRLFDVPRAGRLEQWVEKRAHTLGLAISPEAIHFLMEETADNLWLLANELEKLRTYAGTKGEIGLDDVRVLSPGSRQTSAFDLTDALARRDTARAFALVHERLSAGESPLGIVALTAYQTRTLMAVKAGTERGLRAFEIAQGAGMAPFAVEKALPLARRFTFAQLESAHRLLLEIDMALKRSRMTPDLAMDLLVTQFGKAG